jgi:DNA-binding NtrC family response regulator
MSRILIVDDEPSIGWSLRELLGGEGHAVEVAANVDSALETCSRFVPDAILLDVRLPGRDGISAMPDFHGLAPDAAIIVMTAFGDLDTAVRAVDAGAFDYLVKPFDLDRVSQVTQRAVERHGSVPTRAGRPVQTADELVGSSPPMQVVFKQIALAAPTEMPVLITGPTGTGKELAARAIHANSRRRDRPFVAVNLAAISPAVSESELFGHVRGGFTGATADRKGLFELAGGGTILLDEIAEATPELQAKLLRAIETGEIWPVGSSSPKRVDVRVVAATNRDLSAAVAGGDFRVDLYHRLRAFPLAMPPVADRLDDLPLLVAAFLTGMGIDPAVAGSDFLECLRRRPWPGNVRELRHAIHYAAVMARGGPLRPEHLPATSGMNGTATTSEGASAGDADDGLLERAVSEWFAAAAAGDPEYAADLRDRLVDRVERLLVREAMRHASGNRTAAARLLGLDRSTLRGRLADDDASNAG